MDRRHTFLLEALLWIAAVLIAVGIGILIAQLFSDDPNSVVVAGSLGLILTETVALIAALMRRASETESEQRLVMESGMRAIELIQPDEQGGSAAQSGAALIVLSEMEHHGLALSLLEALWPNDGINPEAAEVVVDLALQSSNGNERGTAASLLAHNGAKTVPPGSSLFYLPETLNSRETVAAFNLRVVYSILSYLVRVSETLVIEQVDVPITDRTMRLNAFTPIVFGIAGLDDNPVKLADDPSDLMRTSAVRLMQAIIPFEKRSGVAGIPSYDREIPFDELEGRINTWLSDHKEINMALFLRIVKIEASLSHTNASGQPDL